MHTSITSTAWHRLPAMLLLLTTASICPTAGAQEQTEDPILKGFRRRYHALRITAIGELTPFAQWCRQAGLERQAAMVEGDIDMIRQAPRRPKPQTDTQSTTGPSTTQDAAQSFAERFGRIYGDILGNYLDLATWAAKRSLYGPADEVLLVAQSLSRMSPAIMVEARKISGDFPIRVMTFNVLNPKVSVDVWGMERRKIVIQHCIEALRPDIVATQETSPQIVGHLKQTLPDYYRWITMASITGGKKKPGGITCAILYNARRFRAHKSDYSLFNESMPTKSGGVGFGGKYYRMIIWTEFEPIGDAADLAAPFVFYNAHLEPFAGGSTTRVKQIQAIEEKILPLHRESAVRVFAGDFNEWTQGVVAETLRKRGFDGHWQGIDWILAARPARIVQGRSIPFVEQTIPPSDHQPVIGYLVFEDHVP